jgi:hypothetical protein
MNPATGALPGPGCSGSVVLPGLGGRNGDAATGQAGLGGRNGDAAAGQAGLSGRNGDAAGGQAGGQLGQGPAQQVRHLLK